MNPSRALEWPIRCRRLAACAVPDFLLLRHDAGLGNGTPIWSGFLSGAARTPQFQGLRRRFAAIIALQLLSPAIASCGESTRGARCPACASLLILWSHVVSRISGSRERGGRTRLQKGENQHNQ